MLKGIFVMLCMSFLPIVTLMTIVLLYVLITGISDYKIKNYSLNDWKGFAILGVVVVLLFCLACFLWSQFPAFIELMGKPTYRSRVQM
ncbi:hypothetical protein A9255_20225 [Xenorhabdus hominickii]|uniref:Uncharacterized protein n=1 Tax=Xenorhabdus hominickii TaxID=351679 RepID=A0A2G0Q0G7_XENHO|nr:hypothetical protein A9255_20225 [Xenorhabdus hominickii]PHM52172.1 hypothetical protein Xhom_04550 [Xenorhabdus hominickii]PHM52692.1 hypothetical protein Xhom_04361 [Xenorhabdus hominickii]